MPVIETSNREVKAFQGLHLYHFWLSSCSQRVRVVLAEKNLEWVDHPVDISPMAMEHATESYQSIHPQGLVPTLVHDGRVVIESIDIIDYLDTHFPDPPLRVTSEAGLKEMHQWMELADAAQHSIKTLTHEFLFKPDRMTPDQLAEFKQKHKNRELCEFLDVFCSEKGFGREEIERELKIQHDKFTALDRVLENRQWLVDDRFTLADIAWIPNVRRLDIMLYPLEMHPNLNDWYQRFRQRSSYRIGIEGCEMGPALEHFREYNEQRVQDGDGIETYKPLSPASG